MSRPKVAIVVAQFDPASGYWESALAGELARRCDLHVVTSTSSCGDFPDPEGTRIDGKFLAGESEWAGASIHRLDPTFEVRARIVAKGIGPLLASIGPDRLVASAPSQVLSLTGVLWAARRQVPHTYVSGEHVAQAPVGFKPGKATTSASAVYRRVVLDQIYRLATARADPIVAYTPDTYARLERVVPRGMSVRLASLPVDRTVFCFSAAERASVRQELGWSDDHVTLYVGKFDSRKNLPGLAAWWRKEVRSRLPRSRMVFVGQAATAASEKVAAAILREGGDGVEVASFQPAERISLLYQAADLGVYPAATIGIQQALCTGLPVIIPTGSELSHLPEILPSARILRASTSLTSGEAADVRELDQILLPDEAGERGNRASSSRVFGIDAFAELLVPELLDG
ncbi:MAG: glycosyltransferase [Actinobacteria bacterium]|nr:MAG: glycosyltransferase [Actinomycetota bacterium]